MNILDEKIEAAESICITGHSNPDGDCIGSALAIYNYIINKWGDKKSVKVFLTEFSNKFRILKNTNIIKDDKNDATIFGLCIVVDASSLSRIDEFKRYFLEAKDTIVFDHHENNDMPAKVSVVFPEAIATCEVLYDFLDKDYIDVEVAKCLYVGIATDSGVFRYKSTTKKTFEIAGRLIDYGFDFTHLLDQIVFNNSLEQRKAQGVAFDRLKLICKGKVSFSYLTDDDLERFNLKRTDIDNIIVYLREINDVKIAAFAYQTGNNIYKISLRSTCDYLNVAEFASMHDGGGHALASGCLYYGTIDVVKTNLEKDLGEFIEKSEHSK